jgi:hypothetical protein
MSKGGGGGSSGTVNTQVEPPAYAKPFLEFGLAQAKDRFMDDMPAYYPNSTTVGFSPESDMALNMVRDRALDPNSLTATSQDVIQQNLMGTNPLMSMAFKPAIDAVTSQFAKSGRYGSGANQQALTSALAPMAYKAQQDALTLAPQYQNLDAQQLAQVGSAREADAMAQLQDNINRFNYEQNIGDQKLQNYMSLVGGGTLGSNTVQPVFRNQGASALGGALGGAQLGNLAGFGGGTGALLGGLLGLL